MSEALEKQFDELDPTDIEAITAHALARIRAGEWNEDIAGVLANMVSSSFGSAICERYGERIVRELERRGNP